MCRKFGIQSPITPPFVFFFELIVLLPEYTFEFVVQPTVRPFLCQRINRKAESLSSAGVVVGLSLFSANLIYIIY